MNANPIYLGRHASRFAISPNTPRRINKCAASSMMQTLIECEVAVMPAYAIAIVALNMYKKKLEISVNFIELTEEITVDGILK
jgi:hypothetical protein